MEERSTEANAVVNRCNYLWCQEYLAYLREVRQLDEHSVTRYRAYLRHVLLWADETLWSQCSRHRPTLPAYVTAVGLDRASGSLAPTTIKKILQTTQRLFQWAKLTYPLEFKDLSASWIDTLRPPRLAQRVPEHHFVTLDEVIALATLHVDPANLALRRDQAGAALLFVSGMRVGALGSLPISAVDTQARALKQWPGLGVRTKNSKTATTYLIAIPELLAVVDSWDSFIRELLPPTAMWYTPITSRWGDQTLSPQSAGLNRAVAIGKRLRQLFAAADLPYQSPHKFRHGHAVWALQHAQTMADYKAVSMNLMHGDIRITDSIYAPLLGSEVQQRITNLAGTDEEQIAIDTGPARSLHGLSKKELAETLRSLAAGLEAGQE